jgi:hypothetical protein
MGATVLKPPMSHTTVFLMGSIEMGTAEHWQERLTELLLPCLVLNPRRDDWQAEASQQATNEYFSSQVRWELSGIEKADLIAVYIDPATKSPITLLELGIVSQLKPASVVVVCPDAYWRSGNVAIVCERYGMQRVATLEELAMELNRRITLLES